MNTTHSSIETGTTMVAKAAPPVSVSIASVAGYNVSELVLWATLIYTVLLVAHKLFMIAKDTLEWTQVARMRRNGSERRAGAPDTRAHPVERRSGERRETEG